jgi:hypothetical protein
MKNWLAMPLVLTAVGLGMLAPAASPCSCDGVPTLAQALETSLAVFRGVATAQEVDPSAPEHLRVTFAVTGYWIGPVTPTYTITTYGSTAGCGFGFSPDTEYLVFAYPSDFGPMTGQCTRNKPIFLAADDLKELGPPKAPNQPITWGLLKVHTFGSTP